MGSPVAAGRRVGLRLAAAALLLAALGFGAELAWRGIRFAGWAGSSPPLVEFDAELGWHNRPSIRLRHRQSDFEVTVELDDRGRRIAPGGSLDPPLVFVGDSITFGWGVEAHETFASRLGTALGRRVVNLGVPGYGTDQSYLALRRYADETPLRSALVIHVLTENDLLEVTRRWAYGRPKPSIDPDGSVRPLTTLGGPLGWVERRSYLVASMRNAGDTLRPPASSAGERDRGASLVGALVERMQRDCAARGADFLFVVPRHEILGMRSPRGVAEVDLGPDLARAEASDRALVLRDMHFNAAGHALVADAILARLARSPRSAAAAPRLSR